MIYIFIKRTLVEGGAIIANIGRLGRTVAFPRFEKQTVEGWPSKITVFAKILTIVFTAHTAF